MKFAFNVDYPDPSDFLDKCAAAQMEVARVHVNPEISSNDLAALAGKLASLNMKAVIVPKYEVKKTGDTDDVLKMLMYDMVTIKSNYVNIASNFPVAQSIGITLPVGIHLAVKSRYFSNFGLHRPQAINMMNQLSQQIKSAGHDVVFPVIIDDIQGDLWKGLNCDVFEVEMLLSAAAAYTLKSEAVAQKLASTNKRVWFGKAGAAGGYQLVAQMVRSLRRIKEYSKESNIEYAFLESKEAVSEFHWSKDGKFLVDVLKADFINLNS